MKIGCRWVLALHVVTEAARSLMLQDGVEETIVSLRDAGIQVSAPGLQLALKSSFRWPFQVWVLTGDKLETAENIARSCGLFAPHRETRKVERRDDLFSIKGEGSVWHSVWWLTFKCVADAAGFRYNLILSPEATVLAKLGDELLLAVLEK